VNSSQEVVVLNSEVDVYFCSYSVVVWVTVVFLVIVLVPTHSLTFVSVIVFVLVRVIVMVLVAVCSPLSTEVVVDSQGGSPVIVLVSIDDFWVGIS